MSDVFKFGNSKGTILRDYLFRVTFGGMINLEDNLCESFTIPEMGVSSEEMLTEFGGVKYMTHQHSAPQISLTLRENASSNVYNQFMMMKKAYVKMDGEKAKVFTIGSGAKNNGKCDVNIEIFHLNGKLAKRHKFQNCTLESATISQFSTTGQDAVKIDVVLNVGKWTC